MLAVSLIAIALLAQDAIAQITGTYTSIELTAAGTPTFSVPVQSETNFPSCTVNCIETADVLGICPDPLAPDCVCKAPFRAAVASCLSLTCTDAEYLRSFELGVEVCDPVYKANPALLPSVSSAIASATKSARDTIATRDPTQLKDYPPCALRCMPDAFSASGCRNFNDRFCTCRCPIFNSVIGPCQLADCKGDDLSSEFPLAKTGVPNDSFDVLNLDLALVTIVESLCAPVGGTSPELQSACRTSSGNGTNCGTGTGIPKPSATGHVSRRSNRLGSVKDSAVNNYRG
ncbi:hypothetical protein ACLMJK_006833 [Lecanora helva]